MGPKPALIRAVLDTNVLVSVLLFGGRLEEFRLAWKAGRLRIVTCKELLDEIVHTLSYPKFRLTPKEISSLLYKELLPFSEVVDISGRTESVSRDPDDDIVIRCSLVGGCSWLVSGDDDLLEIGKYQGVEILSPREFLDRILGG
ncbi:MAG: putative toxin-antitoxin system toxin component, PIN family [Deltaproteobacteria bacterium]|nr:putative toxin-antitoxin system toxin component, PIN family [Deltaproteobacteria bacterium]